MVNRTLLTIFVLIWSQAALASFDIQSNETVQLDIKGYDGLSEKTLFRGELVAGIRQDVATSYKGLAVLHFKQGQIYPIIIDKQSFLLKISGPSTMPSFIGSDENEYFYALLRGSENSHSQYEFADLITEAKQFLDSAASIRTVNELQAMKEKFHTFVLEHYQNLYRSDMLRRLIAQYFMMHEYVDYHLPDTPATDIRMQYQKAIMDGVRNWIDILQPNIPPNEVLNYCASLYYDRSMVTLASQIIDHFREEAYCPGKKNKDLKLTDNLKLTKNGKSLDTDLVDLQGDKYFSFVSTDCPVSMVATIVQARRLAYQDKSASLIVVPLEKLSEKHLSLSRMLSYNNLYFVDDEKWRHKNLPQKIKLPFFIPAHDNI